MNLYFNKFHNLTNLTMGNNFNSLLLAEKFLLKNTTFVGTVRTNRREILNRHNIEKQNYI